MKTASAFLTPQTVVTFPGASLVVVIMWKITGMMFPEWGASYPALLCISLLMGMLLFLLGINASMTPREKIISFIISILNSFMLMASALGVLSFSVIKDSLFP